MVDGGGFLIGARDSEEFGMVVLLAAMGTGI
jgi:hypothetical protein